MLTKFDCKPFISLFILLILSNCKVENLQVPPTVVTKPASDLSISSATLNGEVISEGGQATNDRGFVFSKTEVAPTFSNQKIPMAYGIGTFNTTITNLELNTTYYYRAYATNPVGTQFGTIEKFSTLDAKLPLITLINVSNVTKNSALIEYLTTSDGGSKIIESGVVIGENPSPTIETGVFKIPNTTNNQTINVEQLVDNTTYYVRAYAKNIKGISYSNENTFKTLADVSKNIKNGLIAFYPFDGNTNDQSGNGLNGINKGATLTTNRNEINNSAYSFNNSSIYIPYNSKLKTNNLTTSAWINPNNYNSDNYSIIINRFEQGYNNPSGETWQLILTNTEVWFQILSAANYTIIKAKKVVPLNQWSLISCTYDGKTMNIYINGTEVLSQPTTTIINTDGTSGISIGVSQQANGTFHYFNGKIDDIGIWNRALNSEEINYLYNNGKIN